jgi:HEAT repeat protein
VTRRFGTRLRAALALAFALALTPTPGLAIQEVIGDEPPHATEAVMPFLSDLESEDVSVRMAALLALRELGPIAWPAVPALIEALDDPLVPVRKSAAGALGGIGESAQPAAPALARALSDPHRFVRSWAAMALYEIGPPAKNATSALIHMLKSDQENLRGRSWCASALPRVGADASLAVPALRQALASDSSEEVRAVAVLSIEHYGVEAAKYDGVLALRDALSDEHWKVRGNAACALPELGDESEAVLSDLAATLRDETPYTRGCAVKALGRTGAPAREWIPRMEPLLDDPDPGVRTKAKYALRLLQGKLEGQR